jgi:hypothetical protein
MTAQYSDVMETMQNLRLEFCGNWSMDNFFQHMFLLGGVDMKFIVKSVRYADSPNLIKQRRVYELVWKVYQRSKIEEKKDNDDEFTKK